MYMAIVIVSEARATLPDLLDRVERGEEITITRHGKAVATLVRPDTLTARRADAALTQAEQLHDLIEQGRQTALNALPGIDPSRADALVDEVRASREAR